MKLLKFFTIGAGGGGDVLSAYVVGKTLKEEINADFVCGGVVWERFRVDKKPGPRRIDEIKNVRVINECLAWMKGAKIGKIKPTVAEVADIAGDAIGIDITKPYKVSKAIGEFCVRNSLIPVGVDAGGDILARGKEKKVISPLCDSIILSALAELRAPLAVVGFGSDCELSRRELERYLSEIAELDGLIGVRIIPKHLAEDTLKRAKNVKTHASRIPLLAAKGYFGEYMSWDEVVEVSVLNALIFFLKSEVVYDLNPMAKAVSGCKSIEEANEALHTLGVKTELDLEFELSSLS